MNQSFINKVKQDQYFDHLTADNPAKHSVYYKVFVKSDRWRYGDLYGLCFLPQYKFLLEPFKTYPGNDKKPATSNILYIIGDSFLADKTLAGAFDKFDNVIFLDRRFQFGPIKLDTTKNNYLMMEFAERNLVDYDLAKTPEIEWPQKNIRTKNLNDATIPQPASTLPTSLPDRVGNILFNKDLSRNLEIILFYNKIFTPVKEFKAWINYKLTGWLPKEVAVSTDKKRLLMNVTVDTTYRQSAFRQISDKEVETISNNLDSAQNYYKSIGFKKVFLSVIPNPVSIYDAKRMNYNHLLQRIEKSNKFPVNSLFNKYKAEDKNLYYRSDGHWNPYGLDIWVKTTNATLDSLVK
jgi:hypothetical protein